MQAGDGHLGLIGPRATELALRANEDGAGVGVDEELRDTSGRGEVVRVFADDLDDLGWLAFDRDLAGPGQGWSTFFTRAGERAPILIHLLVGQRALDGVG